MSELAGTPIEASGQLRELPALPEISREIYPDSGGELFFAFVSPLGTDDDAVIDAFASPLKARDYEIVPISLSSLIRDNDTTGTVDGSREFKRITTLQDAGNTLRKNLGHDVVAKLACKKIIDGRKPSEEPQRRAYFIKSVKHPDEAALFRTVYGHGFFLVAIHSAYEQRLVRMRDILRLGGDEGEAESLIKRDENDSLSFGQSTREAFELADFYLRDTGDLVSIADRFVKMIFGALYFTPTKDEYGMQMAAAASQRSSDLSRQVGASILDRRGDLLAVGCNETPKAGGGSYWPGDAVDVRDWKLGYDPNEFQKRERFEKLKASLEGSLGQQISPEILETALAESELKDITEFGRTVHAEMDAVLSCVRRGQPLRRATLYTTTFPCHNCARHIVAAGICRVVYIEPYAKSEAYALHSDSIRCEAIPNPEESMPKTAIQVRFEPFEGVAPRRFSDFFSMRHITGRRIERKHSKGPEKGRILPQNRADLMTPRLQLSQFAYLEREEIVRTNVDMLLRLEVEGVKQEDAGESEEIAGDDQTRSNSANAELARPEAKSFRKNDGAVE